MPASSPADLIARFRAAADPAADRDLLRAFLATRSEPAFAALVSRHGPMVLGVARRVLGNPHDADDAFQATFLVLARKANAVGRPDRLPGWLHTIAVRTATEVRRMRDRRRKLEKASGGRQSPEYGPHPPEQSELAALLDEELAKLPEHYRVPVVLCELQGLLRMEAAARLGLAEGTLSSRLAKARKLLADRLTRRGVTASVAAITAVLAREATARVSAGLATEAARTALTAAASAAAVHAADGVVKALLVTKLKGLALAVGLVVAGAGGAAILSGGPGAAGDNRPTPRTPAPEPDPAALVKQLGSPNFADRDAAERKLKALGPRAKSAVRAAITDADPEVARRSQAVLDHVLRERAWPRFARLLGDDQDARALFEAIRAVPRNVELIEKAEEHPEGVTRLYTDRELELNEQCRNPDKESWNPGKVSVGEVAGWMYLGTFPGAEKGGDRNHNHFLLDFPDMWNYASKPYPFPAALGEGPLKVGARRILAKWTETRIGRPDFYKGLNGAIAHGVPEVVPVAKKYLTEVKEIDDNHRHCLVTIGKCGTKADLPFLAKYADDRRDAGGTIVNYPGDEAKPPRRFQPEKDHSSQMRDLAVAMMLVLSGATREQLDEFGFFVSRYWPRYSGAAGPPAPLPPVGKRPLAGDDPFTPSDIGFIHDADREAAHRKAKAWLASAGPKQ